MSDDKPSTRDNWVRGLLAALCLQAIVAIFFAGQLAQNVNTLHSAISKLSGQMEQIIVDDFVEFRTRLTRLESGRNLDRDTGR